MNKYKEIADSFMSYDDMFETVNQSKSAESCEYCLDNDGIWKRLALKWMLEYFIEKEEYEKCVIIETYMLKDDYVADDIKQNNLNTILNIINDGMESFIRRKN